MREKNLSKLTEEPTVSQIPKSRYSADMILLFEMARLTEAKEKIWFTKLVENLEGTDCKEGKITAKRILHSLNALTDWGMIKASYGETEKGKAGRLLMLSSEISDRAKKWSHQYFREESKRLPQLRTA